MNKDIIWEAELDNKYKCYVVRTDAYKGQLYIKENDIIIFEKVVSLSYGAVFGPDIADVMSWEDTCSNYVDSLST